jgi:acid phosphatase
MRQALHRLGGRCLLALASVLALTAIISSAAAGSNGNGSGSGNDRLARINHIVVIYEENHSFDNLYGGWEGVNGLASADAAHTIQMKQNGTTPYSCLYQDDVNLQPPAGSAPCDTAVNGTPYASLFGNAPFRIDDYIKPNDTTCPQPFQEFSRPNGWLKGQGTTGGCTRDIIHRFYQEQYQINGGAQNQYVTGSDAAGLVMGYYDTKQLPIYQYLHGGGHSHYAVLDDFFQSAFGGSFLNHQWLIAAASPIDSSAAHANLHSILDRNGFPQLRYPPASNSGSVVLYQSPDTGLRDSNLTSLCPAPKGLACGDYGVNTMQPFAQPRGVFNPQLPAQTEATRPTIGDRLTAKGVDWAWYGGGWDNAAGNKTGPGWTNGAGPNCSDPNATPNPAYPYCPDRLFQFHHQPFAYYANYGPDAPGRVHLQDEVAFENAANASTGDCKLKPVSFVKPIGEENEHPGYTGESQGSNHLVDLLKMIDSSACSKDTMVVVTYDEFGGEWDHVPPPGQAGDPAAPGRADWWGPGTRIPTLIVSPFLRGQEVIDHTQYDTTSILATIEQRYGLAPLATRDAAVNSLSNVYDAKEFNNGG